VSRRGRAGQQVRDDWSEYPRRRDAEQDHAPDGEQGTEPAPAAAARGGLGDRPGRLGGGSGDGLGGLGGGSGDGLGGLGGPGDGLGGLGGPGDGLGGPGDGRYPGPGDGPNGRDGLGFRLVDQAQPGRFRHGGRLPGGRARPE
jgi:hypothetical protein